MKGWKDGRMEGWKAKGTRGGEEETYPIWKVVRR
jgi:hypothetical protein